MAKLRISTTKEGVISVQCDLPPGEQCDQSDAELAVVLELLGLKVDRSKDPRRRPGIPIGAPQTDRNKN